MALHTEDDEPSVRVEPSGIKSPATYVVLLSWFAPFLLFIILLNLM